jgi:CRP/FNR family transcriptional regulator
MGWVPGNVAWAGLDDQARKRLNQLQPNTLKTGTVLFNAGDTVRGYAVVLSGSIDVCLTGANGREILLYSVEPGQSCIQSTMGLLGSGDYSAEAHVTCETTLVLLPKPLFLELLDTSSGFRRLVFAAFAERMQTMMHLLEKVAFHRVESRLAERLVTLAEVETTLNITQAELASQIGTAREVVSRRLDTWAIRGWVKTSRGVIHVTDIDALRQLVRSDM